MINKTTIKGIIGIIMVALFITIIIGAMIASVGVVNTIIGIGLSIILISMLIVGEWWVMDWLF